MLNSEQLRSAPMSDQVEFWNRWNADHREEEIMQVSIDQRDVVLRWLDQLERRDLKILEVGCGAGWLCSSLLPYGEVTGTDLSHEVLRRAAARTPQATFIPGDFMSLDFGCSSFDVLVCLEVLSHVADQKAFIQKMAGLLRPGGYLMLATQNRPQLERNDIPPPMPGQIRQWVDRHQLAQLLDGTFNVRSLFSITPQCNRGVLRIVNSARLERIMSAIKLHPLNRALKYAQQKAWLGWTLMCLAQKPADPFKIASIIATE
jgi:2-polyprenyl-3-methyl-5-hydroxy-6-metoxy-1,4-benzoquinol methylase